MSCLHHSIWNVNTEPDNTAWGCTHWSCEFKENHLWQLQKLQHPQTFILLEKCVSFHQIFWCARNHSKEVWKYPNCSWHISIPFNSFRLPQLSERMLYKRNFFFFFNVPRWLSGKESTCLCKRRGFGSWVSKILWRRKWQSTPIFLPGKSHGQRRLVGYSPMGLQKSQTWLSEFFLFYTIQWIPWEATEISLFMLCLTEFCKLAGIWTQTSTGCSVTYMTQSWTTQQSQERTRLTATFTQIKAQEPKDWFWTNWQATPILFFGKVITSRPASELL